MSNKKNKQVTEGDEVEELLRAAEDELLLKLSLNSHMSRVSPSYIDPDLDRRFQALRSSTSPSFNTNPLPQNPKLKDLVTENVQTHQESHVDADHDDLLARFAALKGSISEATAPAADGDDDDDEEDEVDKVIRWAMDAARLENSPPTQQVAPENATGNPEITLQLSVIKPLTGNNFEEWYESFNVHMTLQNLDLRVNEPSKPTEGSSANERSFYERWEHSNRSCLMVMRYTMDKSIKECVPNTGNAKEFMEYVKATYTKIDKAEMTTYLKFLTTTVYDGTSGVRDHIIKLRHYFNKANEMKVELSEKFLKWLILKSLPTSFDVVKLTYNVLKEEWTLEELTSIVVQHEVSLKKNEIQTLALVTNQGSNLKKKFPYKNFGNSKQFKRKADLNQGTSIAYGSSNATKNQCFKWKCHFCQKIGHKQVDCFKFMNWLEKKKKGGDKQKETIKACRMCVYG